MRAAAVAYGRELRSRRDALGWSRRRLSDEAGVSARYVEMLERGERQPTLETMLLLGRALGEPAWKTVRVVEEEWAPEA